ncbi:hypothetical protein [Dermabacter hominis]|uniref:hypothetical protein n=1 Tax=Dermabacter hominis TaxID=36740 RepID=UPI00223BABE8|nr:hypothetical protein [Dermabacter hominis]MCT2025237.1 hypothetical protein [Dermabacter hominis]
MAGDPAHAATIKEHRLLLIEKLEGREEGFARDGRLVAGQQPQAEASWVGEYAWLLIPGVLAS